MVVFHVEQDAVRVAGWGGDAICRRENIYYLSNICVYSIGEVRRNSFAIGIHEFCEGTPGHFGG
jgi:hypothetical protein